MDSNHTESAAAPPVSQQAVIPSMSDAHEARLRCVLDYQHNSLAKPNALEANLGSINSGLLRICICLDEAIVQATENGPCTVERVQNMLPAIDTYLRVTRQIDRFANLEARINEARRPKHGDDPISAVNLDEPMALPARPQSEDSPM